MEKISIVAVEKDDDDGILVTFSDRTIAGYVAEELLELRPLREVLAEAKQARILVIPTND
jgi:hypothetical protein